MAIPPEGYDISWIRVHQYMNVVQLYQRTEPLPLWIHNINLDLYVTANELGKFRLLHFNLRDHNSPNHKSSCTSKRLTLNVK